MKKLMGSLAAKITAIILSFIMVTVLAASVVSMALMFNYDFYTKDRTEVKRDILSELATDEAYNIHNNFQDVNLDEYYKNKNVYYTVVDSKTRQILSSNYSGEDFVSMKTVNGLVYYNEYTIENEYGQIGTQEIEAGEADITVYVAKNMKYTDTFSVTAELINVAYSLRYYVIVFAGISLILSIILLCFLYCSAGHRRDSDTAELNHSDKIPFDIYTAFVALVVFLLGFLVADSTNIYSVIISLAVFVCVGYFLLLGYTMSFATRLKTKTLVKNTILYRLLRFCGKWLGKGFRTLGYIFRNLSLIKKTVLISFGVILAEFIIFVCCMYEPELMLVGWVFATAVIFTAVILIAIAMQKIKNGGEKIAAGDLENKIDTKYMYGDFKNFAESLNNINFGLQSAVNEKMKSERFKTELITNVSHDIKTPLTSIINYVDLIKKENPENENIRQYIDVLDRQSGRLKKLIEDLVEASKASTGNLAVNFSECEVGVLLSQTIGEFDERLSKAGLTPILKKPENPVRIMADGRHLWRVFDNLMSNACKYSQADTRVYMDVFKENGKAVITFRNISKYELNITSDELMERFVRGDSSRNTEGSGLGLSIARSLVELQKGRMELNVDGDLFKVTLMFDAIN